MCTCANISGPIGNHHHWLVMTIDLVGSLPESPNGNSYIIVVGDYVTCWMEVLLLPNPEASTIVRKLINEVFLWFSILEQLHSDQGPQSEIQLMSEVCKLLHIYKTRNDTLPSSM